MTFMAWSEHFVTGYEAIDRQHRGLVDIVNEAADVIAGGTSRAHAVDEVFDRLFDYAATHFRSEEGLMRERGIDQGYLEAHQRLHATFIDEIVLLRVQVVQESVLDADHLLRFLASWLTVHILGDDQTAARQLRMLEGGAPPEVARRLFEGQGRDDTGLEILHAALGELEALERKRAGVRPDRVPVFS